MLAASETTRPRNTTTGSHFCVLQSATFSPFRGASCSVFTIITFHTLTQMSSLRMCAMSSDLRSAWPMAICSRFPFCAFTQLLVISLGADSQCQKRSDRGPAPQPEPATAVDSQYTHLGEQPSSATMVTTLRCGRKKIAFNFKDSVHIVPVKILLHVSMGTGPATQSAVAEGDELSSTSAFRSQRPPATSGNSPATGGGAAAGC